MSFQIICKDCKKESTLTNKNTIEYPISIENTEIDINVDGDVCCGMYITLKLKCTNCKKTVIIKDSFD